MAAPMKPDRTMADGSGLTAYERHGDHRPFAISPQPLAMADVRDLMWRSVGLFRERAGLSAAVEALDRAASVATSVTADDWRHRNLLTVARLIARAALRREESRGGHFRADFPEEDPSLVHLHTVLRPGHEPCLEPWS